MTEPSTSTRIAPGRSAQSSVLGTPVDPLVVLRQLAARDDLESTEATRFRLLWVRADQVGARLETDLTQISDTTVVFRARLELPDGSVATGHAASALDAGDDWASVIERTETRAVGRALDALGYLLASPDTGARLPGSEAGSRLDAGDDRAVPSVVAGLRKAAGRPATAPAPEPTAPREEPVASVDELPDRRAGFPDITAARRGMATAARKSPPETDDNDDDPPLEDYSWTAFWVWAKARNLSTRGQIATVLGHSVDAMTPAAIRLELLEHGYDQ